MASRQLASNGWLGKSLPVFRAIMKRTPAAFFTNNPNTVITFAYVYYKQVVAAGAIFPVVSIIIVLLRFWTRLRKKSGLGADDWLILPALVRMLVNCEISANTSDYRCALWEWAYVYSLVNHIFVFFGFSPDPC